MHGGAWMELRDLPAPQTKVSLIGAGKSLWCHFTERASSEMNGRAEAQARILAGPMAKTRMPANDDKRGHGPGLTPPVRTDLSTNPKAPGGAILIADDDADDAHHSKKTVEKLELGIPVHIVFSGPEVFEYLQAQGRYQDRALDPYPILLLLDLRMPDTDGFEVPKWLEARCEHRRLPVVVLSVVRDLPVVTRAYQLGPRSFLIKPLTSDQFRMTAKALAILPGNG
jgi:CheY-like chemotaxis protein